MVSRVLRTVPLFLLDFSSQSRPAPRYTIAQVAGLSRFVCITRSRALLRAPFPLMSATESLESLRETLDGEHSQLETCVRESFAAMETLHAELSEWQRDLTREQAALDQREAAVSEAESRESAAVARLEQQLTDAREEARQLEEENAEQLQAVEEIDRQLTLSKTELRVAQKRVDELTVAGEAERAKSGEDREHFATEMREIRRLIERQGTVLDRLGGAPSESAVMTPAATPEEPTEGGGLAAELLRRASSRRAQRRTS